MCVCVIQEAGSVVAHKMEDVKANNVHIAFQVPQYVLMTAGEVMFSIPGLEFSYSQVTGGIFPQTSLVSLHALKTPQTVAGSVSLQVLRERSCYFFCVVQAPANMKSVLQAAWLLTVAFGNLIVLIVAEGAGLEQV